MEEILSTVQSEVFGVWFLIGAALVFWMQAGFAMVEAGFTRAKNTGNILMKNLMDFCIGTVMSNPGFPIRPTRSSPRNRPKPIRINITVPIQKSIRFFIRIFPGFFALVKPASTIAKPACIQNTSAAPIKNQTPKTSL